MLRRPRNSWAHGAKLLIDQHGADAGLRAAERADQFLDAADMVGAATWRRSKNWGADDGRGRASTKTEAVSAHPLVSPLGCLRLRCDPRFRFSLSLKARLDTFNISSTTHYLNGVAARMVEGNAIDDSRHSPGSTPDASEGREVARRLVLGVVMRLPDSRTTKTRGRPAARLPQADHPLSGRATK
jgi:hypothetical protein